MVVNQAIVTGMTSHALSLEEWEPAVSLAGRLIIRMKKAKRSHAGLQKEVISVDGSFWSHL